MQQIDTTSLRHWLDVHIQLVNCYSGSFRILCRVADAIISINK